MENHRNHWQWEAELPNGQVSMMLNTDFEIFFDIELVKKTLAHVHGCVIGDVLLVLNVS